MLETHCFRVYVSLILVYFSLAPCEVGIIIISILQTRKMKIKLLTLDLIFFSLFIFHRERQEGKELEDSKGKGRKILEAKQSRKTLERIERESRRIEAVCCGAGK